MRRLLLYWLLAALLTIVAVAADFARHAYQLNQDYARRRATQAQLLTRSANDPRIAAVIRQFGSAQAAAAVGYPPPTTLAFWSVARQSYVLQLTGPRQRAARWGAPRAAVLGLRAAVLYVAWPWLTLAALLVFQASMRRARVRPVHVLRAAVYSCDAAWLLVGAAVIVVPLALEASLLSVGTWGFSPAAYAQALVALLFAAFTTWRLAAAYRLYLQFDHPLATVVAAQTIVVLLVLVHQSLGQ